MVRKILAGRGVEVMETARRYYPAEIERLESSIASLIREGRLRGPISGEELYSFLRRLGLAFSMDVKIRIKEHGELKSIEEKLRQSSS
jgi:DNA-binding TFAR19-related protein (PDSD5 family)